MVQSLWILRMCGKDLDFTAWTFIAWFLSGCFCFCLYAVCTCRSWLDQHVTDPTTAGSSRCNISVWANTPHWLCPKETVMVAHAFVPIIAYDIGGEFSASFYVTCCTTNATIWLIMASIINVLVPNKKQRNSRTIILLWPEERHLDVFWSVHFWPCNPLFYICSVQKGIRACTT